MTDDAANADAAVDATIMDDADPDAAMTDDAANADATTTIEDDR